MIVKIINPNKNMQLKPMFNFNKNKKTTMRRKRSTAVRKTAYRRRRINNPTVNLDRNLFSNILLESSAAAGGAMAVHYMPKLISQFMPSLTQGNSLLTKYLVKGVPVAVISWLLWGFNKSLAKGFLNGAIGFTAVELMNDLANPTPTQLFKKPSGSGLVLKKKPKIVNGEYVYGEDEIYGEDDLNELTMGELSELMGKLEMVNGEYVYGDDEYLIGKSSTGKSSGNPSGTSQGTGQGGGRSMVSTTMTRAINNSNTGQVYPFGYVANARP